MDLTEAERAEILALSDAPPPSRPRASNRRPRWDAPTSSHLNNGRAGTLTPAQEHRSRLDARA
ncbi:hypothetical protein GCM10022225_36030 [Plantactinospora mayteni]|nr:hypothetical protein [Plantactinospora mayteni]